MSDPSEIGVVVIGRNEGERLRTCLASIGGNVPVVYVDSGSTDGSVELARSFGAEVVELATDRPFTAARARNAGFERLVDGGREPTFVQFVDGDCELDGGWLTVARAFLGDHPQAAIATGRLRERFPDRSVYNRLCDLEWTGAPGETRSCGGIFLVRKSAFDEAGGFDADLIAGEEPDLCFRLRQRGWKIHRLDSEMALHDAAMTRVGQWWKRSARSGFADMEAYVRRGAQEPHLRRKVMSNFFWALPPAWLLWPLLWAKQWRSKGALYATHIVLGKLPHFQGQTAFLITRLLGRQKRLIEYK